MLIHVGILCIVQLLINVREEEFPAPNHWEVFLQLMVMQQICASLSVISLLCGPQPETFITVESAIYFCIARMAINGIEIEIVCTSGGCAGIPIHRGGSNRHHNLRYRKKTRCHTLPKPEDRNIH